MYNTSNQSLVEDVLESILEPPKGHNPPCSNRGSPKPTYELDLTSLFKYPMRHYVSKHCLSKSNKSFMNKLSVVFIPNSVHEALADPR